MILVSSCICLWPIYWSQVLSREWRCSWSSADRWCSNYIWVINNLIAYWGATYIRDLMVSIFWMIAKFYKTEEPIMLQPSAGGGGGDSVWLKTSYHKTSQKRCLEFFDCSEIWQAIRHLTWFWIGSLNTVLHAQIKVVDKFGVWMSPLQPQNL